MSREGRWLRTFLRAQTPGNPGRLSGRLSLEYAVPPARGVDYTFDEPSHRILLRDPVRLARPQGRLGRPIPLEEGGARGRLLATGRRRLIRPSGAGALWGRSLVVRTENPELPPKRPGRFEGQHEPVALPGELELLSGR